MEGLPIRASFFQNCIHYFDAFARVCVPSSLSLSAIQGDEGELQLERRIGQRRMMVMMEKERGKAVSVR